MDLSLEWCTYRTTHPSGLYYSGKAKTSKVLDGSYKGSGIAFKLALELDVYAWDTWETQVLQTFSSEDDAYIAEAILVPHTALFDPMCLNQMMGGRVGKYKTRGTLYKKLNSDKRAAARKKKSDAAKAKKAKEAAKIKELKALLKKKP